jgi:hypothetical protein
MGLGVSKNCSLVHSQRKQGKQLVSQKKLECRSQTFKNLATFFSMFYLHNTPLFTCGENIKIIVERHLVFIIASRVKKLTTNKLKLSLKSIKFWVLPFQFKRRTQVKFESA